MALSTVKFRKHVLATAAFERLAIFIETLPDRVLAQMYAWQARITDRRRLNQLDNRLLIDIGLDRADIEREVKKPFWQA